MKPKFLTIITLISLMGLLACTSVTSTRPTSDSQIQVAIQPTFITASTPIPSQSTHLNLTPTSTPSIISNRTKSTPTAAVQSMVEVRTDCIKIENELPGDIQLAGKLLLHGTVGSTRLNYSIYDLHSMRQQKAPLPNFVKDFSLSPDGKWLAYLKIDYNEQGQPKSRILEVIDAEGRLLDTSDWRVNWQYLVGWQDEKNLIIAVPSSTGNNFLILNPFTMQREAMKINLPAFLPSRAYLEISDWLFPNNSLTHWLIMENRYSDTEDPIWGLFGHDDWKILWEAKYSYSMPLWSPNGLYFSIIGDFTQPNDQYKNRTLLRVGQDGKAIALSNRIGEGDTLSWSPDSHLLAGWLQLDPDSVQYDPRNFVLIDVEKSILIDLCFENLRDSRYERNSPPVWSPDGRFLAIGISRLEGENYDKTVWGTAIVDLNNRRIYRLVEGVEPLGWMVQSE